MPNEQKPKNLREAILFTASYFDVFDYPITIFEAWQHLFRHSGSLYEVMEELDRLASEGVLETHYGFYYLPGRRDTVRERQLRYDRSEKMWGKAIRAAKILSYVPYIQSVAVVNSLSYFNCQDTSDIDFLVITRSGKIWTTRLLSTILLHILGLRRHGTRTRQRICLSFYIAEDKFDLSYIARDGLGLFVAFWIAQSAPIFSREGSFDALWHANRWIEEYLPNAGVHITNYHIDFIFPFLSKSIAWALGVLLAPRWVEHLARAGQKKKIVASQHKKGNPSSVLYDDHILKFHPIDWRVSYFKELQKRLKILDSRS